MRSALLFLALFVAVVVCGMGVYSVDANDQLAVDGYGVVAQR